MYKNPNTVLSLKIQCNLTFCSSRNFSIGSIEEKLISLDTAAHFNIFFGTLASCSSSPVNIESNHQDMYKSVKLELVSNELKLMLVDT